MTAVLREHLRLVAHLLGRYGSEERASFVNRLAADPDDEHVLAVASGLELRGGSGAVWGVEPFQYSHPGAPSAAADYAEFQRAMVRIADILGGLDRGDAAERNTVLFRRQLGD